MDTCPGRTRINVRGISGGEVDVGSRVPVIAAALALSLLGEFPSSGTALGIAATTLGVLLAAGALDGWQPSHYRRSPTTA